MKRNILLLLSLCLLGAPNVFSQRRQVVSIDNKALSAEMKAYYRQVYLDDDIEINKVAFSQSFAESIDVLEIPIENTEFIMYTDTCIKNPYTNYQYTTFSNGETYASISVLGDNVQGTIYTDDGTYVLDTYTDGQYVLIKLPDDIPPEAEPIKEADVETYATEEETASSSLSIIRVLVMYTPAAAKMYTNDVALLNSVFLNINNANFSFRNSHINARFELAYVGPTNYVEKTFDEDLKNFRNNSDNYMDEVHTLRSQYEADVCVLLVNNPKYCGLGYVKAKSTSAFCVVYAQQGCTSKYTFAHEIGHIAGCLHDRFTDNSNTPYRYGHGYIHVGANANQSWRTMMSYETACGSVGCRRILYWSNPDILYNGVAMGTSRYENNARVWNNRASTLSNFYSTPTNKMAITTTPNSLYESIRGTERVILLGTFSSEKQQIIDCVAKTSIQLLPGTNIVKGTQFTARIQKDSEIGKYEELQTQRRKNAQKIEIENNAQQETTQITISTQNEHFIKGTIYAIKDYQSVPIQLYGIDGNLCSSLAMDNIPQGESSFSIDVQNLLNGIYIVVAKMDNEQQIVTKLLINK